MEVWGTFLLCVCFGFVLRNTAAVNEKYSSAENAIIYKKHLEWDKEVQKLAEQGVKMLLPTVLEASEHLNLTTACMKNAFTMMKGLRKLKLWALNFVDATGKPSDGILSGNVFSFGDFDQCLSATVAKRDGSLDFRGQYCFISYEPILPKPSGSLSQAAVFDEFLNVSKNGSDLLRHLAENVHYMLMGEAKLGVCVPSGCNENDVGQIFKYIGTQLMMNARVDSCQIEGWYEPFNTTSITVIVIYCFYSLLGIVGAILEYHMKRKGNKSKSTFVDILLCFSITSNFQKLIQSKTPQPHLSFIHGIKVLSLLYIIFAHAQMAMTLFPATRHGLLVKDYGQRFFTQIIVSSYLTVDVFFFIGGFLHAYHRLNLDERIASVKTKLGDLQIVLFRIWRIAPLYLVSAMLVFLAVPRGPYFPKVKREFIDPCMKYWWRNALFINNFFEMNETCLWQSWYVSADMQIFILSVFSVGLLIRSPRKGIIFNVFLIVIGMASTMVWHFATNAPPTVIMYRPSQVATDIFTRAYRVTFPHIQPYFFGVLIGYWVSKKKVVKIPKIYQVFGWPIAFMCFTVPIFVSMTWNTGAKIYPMDSALNAAFGRLSSSLGIAWMVYCCATGNGGIINYILSLKLWVPLSRMSFGIYLIAPTVQVFNAANKRYLYDFHEMHFIWQYMGDILISCLMSLPMVIIFESPFISLQSVILAKVVPKVMSKKNATAYKTEGIDNGAFKTIEATEFELERNEKNIISRL